MSGSITSQFARTSALLSAVANRSTDMAMSSIAVRVLSLTVYRSSRSARACYVWLTSVRMSSLSRRAKVTISVRVFRVSSAFISSDGRFISVDRLIKTE